jgi:hypothetical protein
MDEAWSLRPLRMRRNMVCPENKFRYREIQGGFSAWTLENRPCPQNWQWRRPDHFKRNNSLPDFCLMITDSTCDFCSNDKAKTGSIGVGIGISIGVELFKTDTDSNSDPDPDFLTSTPLLLFPCSSWSIASAISSKACSIQESAIDEQCRVPPRRRRGGIFSSICAPCLESRALKATVSGLPARFLRSSSLRLF